MQITATPKEIAELITELQTQQSDTKQIASNLAKHIKQSMPTRLTIDDIGEEAQEK